MLHRPLTSSPESALARGAYLGDDARPRITPTVARDEAEVEGAPADTLAVARRVMGEVAAERADGASTTLLGAALLLVAAAAVAIASVGGDRSLTVVASALCVLAIFLITTVRLQLQRELVLVGEAQGLSQERARAEARALVRRLLRLD
jgi:hypothetical protein